MLPCPFDTVDTMRCAVLLATLVALACGEPRLTVNFIVPAAWSPRIARSQLRVFVPPTAVEFDCDDIAYRSVPPGVLAISQSALIELDVDGRVDLGRLDRTADKLFVAEAFDDEGRLLVAGCAPVGRVTDDRFVRIEGEPATLTFVSEEAGASGTEKSLHLRVVDPAGQPALGAPIRWEVRGGAGWYRAGIANAPAQGSDGGELHLTVGQEETGADVPMPDIYGPYQVDVGSRWARMAPYQTQSMTFPDPSVASIGKPAAACSVEMLAAAGGPIPGGFALAVVMRTTLGAGCVDEAVSLVVHQDLSGSTQAQVIPLPAWQGADWKAFHFFEPDGTGAFLVGFGDRRGIVTFDGAARFDELVGSFGILGGGAMFSARPCGLATEVLANTDAGLEIVDASGVVTSHPFAGVESTGLEAKAMLCAADLNDRDNMILVLGPPGESFGMVDLYTHDGQRTLRGKWGPVRSRTLTFTPRTAHAGPAVVSDAHELGGVVLSLSELSSFVTPSGALQAALVVREQVTLPGVPILTASGDIDGDGWADVLTVPVIPQSEQQIIRIPVAWLGQPVAGQRVMGFAPDARDLTGTLAWLFDANEDGYDDLLVGQLAPALLSVFAFPLGPIVP